ncbi:putative transporter [Flagelloscypha sp. PMI_526]|nr:putative transporter [Flagelloscypha sp. PMI_526]
MPDSRSRNLSEHNAFLLRLDFCLLTWAWISYLFKQVDSSNYRTAYASGMKEELDLYGEELNYMHMFYRAGYTLFVIPSQLFMIIYRPSLYLPTLEIIWGLLTACMAGTNNIKLSYVLRFLIGVAEASAYPGILSILSNWYASDELATRVAIFGTSYPASGIFVNFLQANLHKNMDGVQGLSGWRWLFILNGVLTIIVASTGFIMIPDHPGSSRAFWLTSVQKEYAKKRLIALGKKVELSGVSRSVVRQAFMTWPLYLFTIAFTSYLFSTDSTMWMQLWLKSETSSDGTPRFSVEEINIIPIGGYVIMIVSMLFTTNLSDRTGNRVRYIVVQQLIVVVGNIVLSMWPSSFGWKMFTFLTLFCTYASGNIMIAWMSDICKDSPEWRILNIGAMVVIPNAIDMWQNVLVWPASEAPRYPSAGYKVAVGMKSNISLFQKEIG